MVSCSIELWDWNAELLVFGDLCILVCSFLVIFIFGRFANEFAC